MSSKTRWPWEIQGATAAHQAKQARRAHQAIRGMTIFLPLAVGLLLTAAVAAWIVWGASGSEVMKGADLIIIVTTVVWMFIGLPVLAVLVFLIILTTRAQRQTPVLAHQILQTLSATRQIVGRTADKAVFPLIQWRARWAAWRAAWQAIRQKR